MNLKAVLKASACLMVFVTVAFFMPGWSSKGLNPYLVIEESIGPSLFTLKKSSRSLIPLKNTIEQRNELSRRYNEMSHIAAKLSCELQKVTQPAQSETFVSITGAWCEKITPEIFTTRAAYDLTYAMSEFLRGKKVGSFGDGPGTYKMIMDKDNKVESYHAFDGGPYYYEGSKGTVQYMDLTASQFGWPLFDWVISLEVAEHIDAKFESIYLDNIVRHAAEGVIISWAYVGQPGIQHINCRDFPYVIEVMDNLGFNFNQTESEKLRKSTDNIYYKVNVSVFRRKDSVPVNFDML